MWLLVLFIKKKLGSPKCLVKEYNLIMMYSKVGCYAANSEVYEAVGNNKRMLTV